MTIAVDLGRKAKKKKQKKKNKKKNIKFQTANETFDLIQRPRSKMLKYLSVWLVTLIFSRC